MNNKLFKSAIIIVLACVVIGSCNKESDKPSSPLISHTGQVTFYNLENNCSSVKIVCEDKNGIITKQYIPDSVECNDEGTFTLTLDTGVHKFTATCGNLTLEKEFTIKENECIKQGVGWYLDTAMLAGIWTLDLTLGIGNCDETMLEDEAHIPPTLHFNPDWTITFDTDPVESDLNGSNFTNGYDIGLDGTYNDVKIWCNYDDGTDKISFQCSLHYDNTTKKYTGTYTNQWTDGALCIGNVVMYK